MAYIKRQFRTILLIVVPLAVVVFVTSAEVLSPNRRGPESYGVGALAHSGVPAGCGFLGLHRLPGHVARHPRERAHRSSCADRFHGCGHAGGVPIRWHHRAVHSRTRAARVPRSS